MSDTEEKRGQRPVAEFRGSGGIKVAVWKHKHEEGPDSYSIRMDRSYREDGGDFKSTQYLRDQDLLRSQKLLAQADLFGDPSTKHAFLTNVAAHRELLAAANIEI